MNPVVEYFAKFNKTVAKFRPAFGQLKNAEVVLDNEHRTGSPFLQEAARLVVEQEFAQARQTARQMMKQLPSSTPELLLSQPKSEAEQANQ